MSDRKYRQRGYQDSGENKPQFSSTPKPKPQDMTFGPRPLNMPGARTVSRCAMCGTILPPMSDDMAKCPKCGLDLHSCKMCNHFDPGSRFECRQPVLARISPKDTHNTCTMFAIKQSVERETTSGGVRANDARAAFENLFKK
ncbi:MAG TPA: hypothetical protein VN577_04520 [Terriglobales bacterium]|nr:hypothetical protein [Terriglobales bacterium]